MNIAAIQSKIDPIVHSHDLEIVSIKWDKLGHQKVLSISLQDKTGQLDLQQANQISAPLSEALDELEFLNFEYILDIGSPGVEKELSTHQEIVDAVGRYVHLDLKNGQSLEADLVEVTDDEVILKYFEKGRPRKTNIKLEEIKRIRLAIKF